MKEVFEKVFQKSLTKAKESDIILKLLYRAAATGKKKMKKLLKRG